MSNRGTSRGGGRGRGRGRGSIKESPDPDGWQTIRKPSNYKKGESSTAANKTAKDVLLGSPAFQQKHRFDTILVIDPEIHEWVPDLWELKNYYLGSYQFPNQGKSRSFYQAILTFTNSVDFHHTLQDNKKSDSQISYSKAFINKVYHPKMWGVDLNQQRPMMFNKEQVSFNYWDYIEAWNNAFLYQNTSQKHTWFLRLSTSLEKFSLPAWFYIWWDKFGPDISVLPGEISTLYLPWTNSHPVLRGDAPIPIGMRTLKFFTKYELPWIFKWDIQISTNELNLAVIQRTYWFRWWSSYDDTPNKVLAIKQDIDNFMLQAPKPKPEVNPFDEMKSIIRAKYPQLTDDQVLVKCLNSIKESLNKEEKKEEDISSQSTEEANYLAGESQADDMDESGGEDKDGPSNTKFLDALALIKAGRFSNKGKETDGN